MTLRQLMVLLLLASGGTQFAMAQTQWEFESEFVTGELTFDDQNPNFAPFNLCTSCVTEFEFTDPMGNVWNEIDSTSIPLFNFGDSTAPSDLGFVIFFVDDTATPLGDGSQLAISGENGLLNVNSPSGTSMTGTFRVVPEPDAMPLAAMASLAMLACVRRKKNGTNR